MKKIGSKKELEEYLAELAKVSVNDALRVHDAESEKRYQSNIEKRVGSVSPKTKEDTSEDETPDLKGTGGQPVRQDEPPPEEKGLDIDDPNAGDDAGGDDEFTPDDITVDAIADKLNSIRSGRSTKDGDIIQKMDDYVRALDDPDRVKLYGFLKKINDIVAVDQAAAGGNVKKPDSQKEPEEPEAQKMARVKDLEKRRELKKSQKAADTQTADQALFKGDEQESSKPKAEPKKAPPKQPKEEEPPHREDRSPPIRVGSRSKGVMTSVKTP